MTRPLSSLAIEGARLTLAHEVQAATGSTRFRADHSAIDRFAQAVLDAALAAEAAEVRPVIIDADTFESLALMGRTPDGRFVLGEGGAQRVMEHARRLVKVQNEIAPLVAAEAAPQERLPGRCQDCGKRDKYRVNHPSGPLCYTCVRERILNEVRRAGRQDHADE